MKKTTYIALAITALCIITAFASPIILLTEIREENKPYLHVYLTPSDDIVARTVDIDTCRHLTFGCADVSQYQYNFAHDGIMKGCRLFVVASDTARSVTVATDKLTMDMLETTVAGDGCVDLTLNAKKYAGDMLKYRQRMGEKQQYVSVDVDENYTTVIIVTVPAGRLADVSARCAVSLENIRSPHFTVTSPALEMTACRVDTLIAR